MSTGTPVHVSALAALLAVAACSGSRTAESDDPERARVGDLDAEVIAPPRADESAEPATPLDHGSTTCAFRDAPSSKSRTFGAGWSAIPRSSSVGVAGRLRHSAVWTGREMIVFGGAAASGSDAIAAADGAVLEVDATLPRWRKLPDWPHGGGRIGHTATWTGQHMIIWGGADALRGSILPRHTAVRNDGAVFDPCSGHWTKIEGSPLKPRYGATAVWVESTHELVVAGGTGVDEHGLAIVLHDAAAYSPANGTWRSLPDPPLAPNGHGVWDGARVQMVSSPYVLTFDPRTDRWDVLHSGIQRNTTVFDVFATGASGSSLLFGAMSGMEPATCEDDAMHVLHFAGSTASTPRALSHASRELLAQQPRSSAMTWYGAGKLYTFGGRGCGPLGYLRDGAVLDVANDSWSALPTWDLPYEGARDAATVVWTGRSAIVYGGFRYPGPGLLDDGAAFTP